MNYQLADGPGYVNDEGELRPGVNLFAWRDLLKRTAVLQHELGLKSTMIWTHMTNVRDSWRCGRRSRFALTVVN